MSPDPIFDPELMTAEDVAAYLDRGVSRALDHLVTTCGVSAETVESGWCIYKGRGVFHLVVNLMREDADYDLLRRALTAYFYEDEVA